MTNNDARKNRLVPISAALAATVLAVGILVASQSLSAIAQSENENDDRPSWQYRLNKRFQEYEDGTFKVRAGAGGPTAPLTAYFPRDAEIKVGEMVVWNNPSKVGEPHTVTFIKDSSFPPLEAPYLIEDAGALVPLDPGANADPTVIPGPDGKSIVVVANARAYSPVSVTDGEAQYLPLNATYTMTGNESYVNSGLIWPEGQVPPGLPEITSFSVKFEKEGTYDYLCILHPWMAGRVVVN